MTLYSYAGVSRRQGRMRPRWANDQARIKTLIRTGHTDIDLIPLPKAMTRTEALTWLISIDFDNGNPEVREALAHALDRRQTPEPARAQRVEPAH